LGWVDMCEQYIELDTVLKSFFTPKSSENFFSFWSIPLYLPSTCPTSLEVFVLAITLP
jgi:hypothetical protein